MSKYEESLRYKIQLDDCESPAVWSDAGFSTVSGISSDTLHVSGERSLSFDKIGTNNVNGILVKTVSSQGLDLNNVSVDGIINIAVHLSSVTNVDSVDVYLVSDESFALTNSVKWSESTLSVGWNILTLNLVSGVQAGAGVDWKSIKHLAAGIVMASASNTLSDIRLDSIWINVPLYVSTV